MSLAASFMDSPPPVAVPSPGAGGAQPSADTPDLMTLLREHAEQRPGGTAFIFPLEDECYRHLSWAGLYRAAHLYAACIADAGVPPGETVVILSASVAEQVLGFLGAIAAGCVPTIVSYPSSKQSAASFVSMLRPVLTLSRARLLLYGKQFAADVSGLGEFAPLLGFAQIGTLSKHIATVARQQDQTLFLQFSSGTTGTRKAVAVTQSMLTAQAAAYAKAIDLHSGDKVVSWLPLYHDMGLVAAFLIPLCHGVTGIHISPFQWLMRPDILFELIEQHRATLLWLPNFAYELCASRIDAGSGARLASLRGIINCSEPVRQRAHDSFQAAFRGIGAEPPMLQSCYALAETTFAVTQSDLRRPVSLDRVDRDTFLTHHRAVPAAADAPADSTMALLSSGAPIDGTAVRIGGARSDREVGEIEVRSSSLFAGYLFNAQGVDPFTGDGWFRTGDLGYLAGGELYVTGRSKDIIIRRGHNIYPTDIEEVVAQVEGCKGGRVVAFGADDEELGTQNLIVMVERSSESVEPPRLRTAIRDRMLEELNETAADIVVCEPNTLRKSTSGKLSRTGNRQLYLEQYARRAQTRPDAGSSAAQAPASDPLEQELQRIWCRALRLNHVPVDARLFAELGGDSLAAMQVVGDITRQFGRAIEPSTLLREDTIARQVQLLRSGLPAGDGVLVCLQTGGARPPLFLVHAASGRAWPYRTLLPYLDPDRPVYALQAPELFGGGNFLGVEDMAALYLDRLLEVQPQGPYLLGGWSFGGVIAHALANRLAGTGRTVRRLVLFDTDPPAATPARLRHALRLALIRAAALHGPEALQNWLSPRGASSCARFLAALRPHTGSARELALLMRFAAPGRLADATAGPRSIEELWGALKQELETHCKPEESRPFLIAGQSAQEQLQNARVLVKNRRQSALHRPRQRFDGCLDIFAADDPQRLRAWGPYASQPPRIQSYPVVGTEALSPHFCMFEPHNVALFGADLNTVLNQEPRADQAPPGGTAHLPRRTL